MGINKVQNKIWNADHTQVTGYNTIVDLTDASSATENNLKNIRDNVAVYLNDGEMYEGTMDEYGNHSVEVNSLQTMSDTLNGYVETLSWKLDDVNAAKIISSNIRQGVSILGVDGNVPVPSGTLSQTISTNGTYTYDVSRYANATIQVNVSGGGGSMATIDAGYAVVTTQYALTDLYIYNSAFSALEQIAQSQTPFDVRLKIDVKIDLSEYGMGQVLAYYLIFNIANTNVDFMSGSDVPLMYNFLSQIGDNNSMHGPITLELAATTQSNTVNCYWYNQTPAGMQVQVPTIHIEN